MFEVTKACGAFMKLLEEQLDRVAGMKDEKTDFSTKQCVTIGIIDGDGIGPIITRQASRVLEKLLAAEIEAGTIKLQYIEGLTIENREKCGKAIPDDILAQIKLCDVLLKGPRELQGLQERCCRRSVRRRREERNQRHLQGRCDRGQCRAEARRHGLI